MRRGQLIWGCRWHKPIKLVAAKTMEHWKVLKMTETSVTRPRPFIQDQDPWHETKTKTSVYVLEAKTMVSRTTTLIISHNRLNRSVKSIDRSLKCLDIQVDRSSQVKIDQSLINQLAWLDWFQCIFLTHLFCVISCLHQATSSAETCCTIAKTAAEYK